MDDTVSMLTGAAKFLGSLLIVMGTFWLFLNFKDQNRMTGPVILIVAGAVMGSLAGSLQGEADGL